MTNSNPRTNQEILTQRAYATDEHLSVRYRTHDMYSQPKIDFQKWVIEMLNWRGDEYVLDVGAGPGSYFRLVREHAPDGYLFAGDLSFGMAQQACHNSPDEQVCVLNLDAQYLPFPDHFFDVVLANHMLYHVPNIKCTLDEIHRVLRPDGCLVAATNGERTMPELDTLTRRAYTLLGFPRHESTPAHVGFSLESGTRLLAQHFRAVARYDLPSTFHFPEVEPVMAYLDSARALREPQLPPGVTWEAFQDKMENQISRLINHFGELQISKVTGVLIATNGGGFAADYLKGLNGDR